jgi:5'-deoxynucleotidase YfbR-like HD superfamily hydrolase
MTVTVKTIKGPTIMLASGRYFDLEDPDSSEICIEDIAHALAHICRYTGHCRTFYSVAQHSVLVSHVVPREHAYAGLMHDAAEALIGDVAKPLKVLLPDYQRIEDRIEASLFRRFGLPAKLPQCVKDADRLLLRTEQRDLMGANDHQWTFTEGAEPLPEKIVPLTSPEAKAAFLARYAELRQLSQSADVRKPFLLQQEALGEPFASILAENRWALYDGERSETDTPLCNSHQPQG